MSFLLKNKRQKLKMCRWLLSKNKWRNVVLKDSQLKRLQKNVRKRRSQHIKVRMMPLILSKKRKKEKSRNMIKISP